MKKVKLFLLLFMFLCINVDVKAVIYDNAGGIIGNEEDYRGCTDCNFVFDTNAYGFGVRLTFVDSGGNRVAGTQSVDIFRGPSNISSALSVPGKLDRYEVVKGTNIGFASGYSNYHIDSNLYKYYDYGYEGLVSYLRDTYLVNRNGPFDLFSAAGTSYDQFIKDCNSSMYLAVEPILVIRNTKDNQRYVGTISEFARVENQESGYFFYGITTSFSNPNTPFPLYLHSSYALAGVTAVGSGSVKSSIISDMNKVNSDGTIPGFAIYLYYMYDVFPGCGNPPIPDPNACLTTSSKAPCANISNGYIKDSTNWSCIFKSSKTSSFYSMNNNYCAVYCREEVNYSLPGNSMTVLAGTHFVLGDPYIPNGPTNFALKRLSPIIFTGIKECRVTGGVKENDTGIDYVQFTKDYNSVNNQIPSAWDRYQQKQADYDAAKKLWDRGGIDDAGSEVCDYYYETLGDESGCIQDPLTGECKKILKYRYRYKYTIEGGYATASNGIFSGSASSSGGSVYSDCGGTKDQARSRADSERSRLINAAISSAKSSRDSAKSNYDSLVNQRENILSQIRACNNFSNDIKFNPEVSFKYYDSVYGTTKKLDSDKSERSDVYYYSSNYNTSVSAKTSTISYYNCSGGYHCSNGSVSYPSNQRIKKVVTKTYDYELPSGVYQYTNKVTGSNKNTGSIKIYTPYSNLPVAFATPEGKYNYVISVSTLGSGHKFNNRNNVNLNYYECYYKVKNKILEDDPDSDPDPDDPTGGGGGKLDGLNVIYRPISLKDPFPSIDGDGRRPGENWNNSSYIYNFITNNRDVDTYDIYTDLDPLYTITLTPGLIQEIREYNEQQEKNNRGGYTDFNLTCDSNGRKCKSKFIRESLTNYNFSKYFSGCGIKSKHSGLSCSNGDEW